MTYGFIGTGNMGGALARALVREVSPLDVYLNNRTPAKAEALAAELGARADTAAHIAAACDYIFLGVKPNLIAGVLAQLAPTLAQRTDKPVLVSMAAGVTIAALEQAAPGCPILRIMPNTACAVGAGLTLYDANALLTKPQLDAFLADMAASGRLEALPEHLIDAGSAVAGCGGAFACLFMEGLADGAVTCGLPRDKANTFAAQMLLGAARLALESGKPFGQMKDEHLLSRRHHHCRCPRAGGGRPPRRRHERRHRRLRKDPSAEEVNHAAPGSAGGGVSCKGRPSPPGRAFDLISRTGSR